MPTPILRLALASLLLATISLAANAADTTPAADAPDLATVRAAIEAKNYNVALAELKEMVVNDQHPDVYSLMGFALRKTGDRAQAMTYYRKALDADPTHKGALEYQGELFVELGQIAEAKQNLAKLDQLCGSGCEEQEDLKEAIADASKAK